MRAGIFRFLSDARAELAVFAAVAGAFSGKIAKNGVWAFPAVIAAQVCGRAAFFASYGDFSGGFTSFAIRDLLADSDGAHGIVSSGGDRVVDRDRASRRALRGKRS